MSGGVSGVGVGSSRLALIGKESVAVLNGLAAGVFNTAAPMGGRRDQQEIHEYCYRRRNARR